MTGAMPGQATGEPAAQLADGGDGAPVVIVSSDTHVGPLLVEQLRPYCPSAYLDAFDRFVEQHRAYRPPFKSIANPGLLRNHRTEGHYDLRARTRDMDYDGVAAEIIFHGSQNNEPIPFRSQGSFGAQHGQDLELAGVGNHIYNRWLADFVAGDPDRHIGLAHLPMWDIPAAVKELEWASGAGLRAMNFPAMQAGIVEYNDRAWEPLWSACEALDMPLTTHSASSGPLSRYSGPEADMIIPIESGGWYARRSMHWMALSGVFERHPRLKLVLTEQPGDWWPSALAEMDSIYAMQARLHPEIRQRVPRRPSEYCSTNVFVGASFLAHHEAVAAWRDGYADRLMWGSDYPHVEGTFQYPASWSDESMTRQSLRFTFGGLPAGAVRAMAGQNAAAAYGLDYPELARLASSIGAPTYEDLARPLERVPEDGGLLAFRREGTWH